MCVCMCLCCACIFILRREKEIHLACNIVIYNRLLKKTMNSTKMHCFEIFNFYIIYYTLGGVSVGTTRLIRINVINKQSALDCASE